MFRLYCVPNSIQISACNCAKGVNGAPCSHQVAVSSKIHNNSTTLLPLHHKRTFAKVPLGNAYEQNIGFYASIHEKRLHENGMENMDELATDIRVKGNSTCEVTNDDVVEGDVSNADSTVTENIKSDLNNNLFSRLDEDENLQKGVQKFVISYQSGPAPSASLASAFHHFGRNYGEIIGNKLGQFITRYAMECKEIWKVHCSPEYCNQKKEMGDCKRKQKG